MIKEIVKNVVNKEPLVSFIVPAYNLESYILRALNSILQQEFPDLGKLEVIVVNDGSKDNTKKVALEILNSERGKSINWVFVDQANGGVSIARNVGLESANGEYIRFLDGDDIISPDSTKKLIEASKEFGSDFVFGKFVMKTSKGKIIMKSDDLFKADFQDIETKAVNKQKLITDFLCYSPFIHLGNILIKRAVLEREKIRFTPGTKIAEDFEFIAKALYNANKVVFLNEYVYTWFYRKSSATKTNNLNMFHYVGVMKRLVKYFKTCNEVEIAEHIQKNAIPLAYGQILGILAYNRLDYILWHNLAKNNEIKKYVARINFSEDKRGFHSKMYLANKVFHLSPTLLYIIMRIARRYHEFWTE
ncbi:MAG: glycosyltransferase family 2 protein [Fervidobacterium sp.]